MSRSSAGEKIYDGSAEGFGLAVRHAAPALATPLTRLFALSGVDSSPVSVKRAREELTALGRLGAVAGSEPTPPGKAKSRGAGALKVRNLQVELQAGRVARPVIRGVDLEVAPGERIALMGPNGAGKSTLLRTFAGILEPSFGSAKVPGGCALLSQRPDDYLVRERVGEELPGEEGRAALAAVGLDVSPDADPRDLSGGERQRLALAIAMAGRGAGGSPPGLVCLDEPTRGLDRSRKDDLAAWIAELAAAGSGAAVIVATHDVEFAARFATRVVLLARGRVIADAGPREVLGGGWYFATETARVTGGSGRHPGAGRGAARRPGPGGGGLSWQAATLSILALVLIGGFVWFERSRPPARIVAAVAAMAALGVAGRLAFAPIPNVVATTDVALLAGYSLGAGPGFAVGALSGLVSNFWLGQGPWTPWQMAGWGLVGIGGALLARFSARRMGRLGLALVAALAGLAYGALLDLSVMVEFGGEQSLDRYLALSARALPFNIAHAAGNFVVMFAAGPALIRMLDRYRGRFDHRWSDVPLGRAAATIAILTVLLAPIFSGPEGASAEGREDARTWLETAQNDDGGYGTGVDVDSSADMTAWAMVGLEAAGINPRDVVNGKTPVEYLRENSGEISSVGDIELVILGLEGAGLDSRSFQGRNLVNELKDEQAGDGSFQHQINLTAYAILAQRAAGESGSSLGAAASWLRAKQNRNGGWGSVPGAESEPDSTGSVMQALKVAPGKHGMIDDAAKWLERNQHKDGGWSLTEGASSNSQSTAWAIQGLVAAGISPGTIKNDGTSGADFLFARQSSDGHFAYSGTSDQTPVWVTAQAMTAIAQQAFPIPPVEREENDPIETPSQNNSDDGTTTPPPTYTPPSGIDLGGPDYDPSDFGIGADSGGSSSGGGDGTGNGSGPGSPSDGGNQGIPGDALESEPSLDPGTDPLESFTQSAATPLAELPSQDSPLPGTFVFLAAVGLLAAGLGAGFVWFRRRQL